MERVLMNIKLELNEYLDPQRYRLGARLVDVELLRRVIRHVEKQEQLVLQLRETLELAVTKSCSHCAGEMTIARKLCEDMEKCDAESNSDGDD
jgi:hypothetical protein